MGQNSKKRRDAKRRRQSVERSGRSDRPNVSAVSIPTLGENREVEEDTLHMLIACYGQLPRHPDCPGPLLIHRDGAFECHGPNCPGGTVVYHGEDALAPCGYQGIPTIHACGRCAQHAESPGDLEFECSGVRIDHFDGVQECSRGDACLGPDAFHASFRSCGWSEPCPRPECKEAEPVRRGWDRALTRRRGRPGTAPDVPPWP